MAMAMDCCCANTAPVFKQKWHIAGAELRQLVVLDGASPSQQMSAMTCWTAAYVPAMFQPQEVEAELSRLLH